jgi:cytochrome P450
MNNAEFFADPYPTYARLRASEGPTYSEAEATWLVTRYDDVEMVLKDPRFSKRLPEQGATPLSKTMLFQDPPEHKRLRGLAGDTFTPSRVRGLEEQITSAADALLDANVDAGRMDFIADFAMPLVVSVIARMLGVPPEDGARLHQWSAALITAAGPPGSDTKAQENQAEAIAAMSAYFSALVADQSVRPSDNLLGGMIKLHQQHDRMTREELVGTCMLLMIAGHETTVNLLGNGLYTLLRHPLEFRRLKADPGLISSAVDEMLRVESPVQRGTFRVTTKAVQIGPALIEQGSLVAAIIGAANRDPSVFPDPDRFDIARDPNPHLAFGNGIHYCMGSSLARTQARIGFSRLFSRLPALRLAVPAETERVRPVQKFLSGIRRRGNAISALETPRWRHSKIVRGLTTLQLEWST